MKTSIANILAILALVPSALAHPVDNVAAVTAVRDAAPAAAGDAPISVAAVCTPLPNKGNVLFSINSH